jgi:undecaprenyl diphosphate synthase
MDGNGRWARLRHRPRAYGHRMGVRAARRTVEACHSHGVKALTLFAFSQENWHRPTTEVSLLMKLFRRVLAAEIRALHANGVRLHFIGDRRDLPASLCIQMRQAETLTAANPGLQLQIALGYGGQWDIAQAARRLCESGEPITEAAIERHLVTAELPLPDLLIRTGGEHRLSNFMLWQLAYAELYFTDVLWPDFGADELRRALDWYATRERRFGRVPEAG